MNFRIATLLRIAVAAGMLVASALPLVAGGDSEDGGLNDLNGLGDGGPKVNDAAGGALSKQVWLLRTLSVAEI